MSEHEVKTGLLGADAIHSLCLAKQLLMDGRRLCAAGQDRLTFSRGLLSLHDGIEIVLAVAAMQHGGEVKEKTTLLQYAGILAKQQPDLRLSEHGSLVNLNRARVQIKHGGLLVDRGTLSELPERIWALGTRTCSECLHVDLHGLWLTGAIRDDTVRQWLALAESEVKAERWKEALISLAYAIYEIIEKLAQPYHSMYRTAFRKVRAEDWEPTEPYTTEFRLELLSYGIDPREYAHFRRVTPEMGRLNNKLVYNWDKWYGHAGNWTEVNARWCLGFCIDTALKIQALKNEYPTLKHYMECFQDVIEPGGDVVDFYDGTRFPPPFAPSDRKVEVIYRLQPGDHVVGSVRNEDGVDEIMVIGLEDSSGNRIGDGIGWASKSQVKWESRPL